MALQQEYYRGLSGVISTPPEQRAVRSLGQLSGAMGDYTAQRQVQGMRLGTSMLQGNAALADAKRDMRLARRDAVPALAITGLNTGIQALGAHQMKQESELQRMRDREEADYWRALGEVMERNYAYIVKKLSIRPEPTATATTSVPTQAYVPAERNWTMEGGY